MRTILILALITLSVCTKDNEMILGGGIHDSIRTYSRESLIKLALKMEDFERTKLNIHLLGGLHDYVYSLSKDKVITIVLDFVHRNPELDSVSRIEELASIKPELSEETFDSYLLGLDRESLIQVALQIESTLTKKNKSKGKLIEEIDSFSNERVISEIKNLIARNPKILKNEKVIKVEEKQILSESDFKARLSAYPQEYLADLAISCENYKRNVTGEHLLGGLHDYAYSLEKERLIEVILDFSSQFPELKRVGDLESMNARKRNPKPEWPRAERVRSSNPSFESSLSNYSIEDLRSFALFCENYERKQSEEMRLGGLHDYIMSLSKEEIISIIVDYVNQYPELQKVNVAKPRLADEKDKLTTILDKKSQAELIKICLNLESYDRKKRNIRLFGGLHDYVDTLTRDDLYAYIKRNVGKYPELLTDVNFFGN